MQASFPRRWAAPALGLAGIALAGCDHRTLDKLGMAIFTLLLGVGVVLLVFAVPLIANLVCLVMGRPSFGWGAAGVLVGLCVLAVTLGSELAKDVDRGVFLVLACGTLQCALGILNILRVASPARRKPPPWMDVPPDPPSPSPPA